MASVWGNAWGASWGNSWGAISAAVTGTAGEGPRRKLLSWDERLGHHPLFRRLDDVAPTQQVVAEKQQLEAEAAKIADKKAKAQAESDDYWALYLYEQLLLKAAEQLTALAMADEAIAKRKAKERDIVFAMMAMTVLH